MPDVTSSAYWEAQDEALIAVILPVVLSAATKAARLAFDDLVLQFGAELGVSWDVVNEAAKAWAKDYTFDLVKGINETSKNFLNESISNWIESGESLEKLIEQLAPMFGDVRASMIGITEATRIFQNGSIEIWKNSGVVSGFNYRSVEDPLVCAICSPLNEKTFNLDDGESMPPQHVNCRCFSVPVLDKT